MKKISRREFIKLGIAAGAGSLVMPRLTRPSAPAKAHSPASGEVLSGNWALTRDNMELVAGPRPLESGLEFSSDRPYYLSSVLRADFPFNAVGARWDGKGWKDGTGPEMRVRASAEGQDWSPWIELRELDAFTGDSHNSTDLAFVSGRYLQLALSFPPEMVTDRLATLTYINSLEGPTAAQASEGAGEFSISKLTPFTVIGRAGWGANEAYRLDANGRIAWPPTYSSARNIIVHHTATSDGGADPAAMVRAIYYYHAKTNRWGDMGYNFLVDKNGNVYEGRFGGLNVVGAHALGFNMGSIGIAVIGNFETNTVPTAAANALSNLCAYKSVQHGVPIFGTFLKDGKDYPTLMGHRDVNRTTCPGAKLYEYLPTLKSTINQAIPPYAVAWISYKLPISLELSAQSAISVTVKNSGSQVLKSSGAGRALITYRWLLPNGSPYTAEAGMSGATPLPKDIAPYQTAVVTTSVRTPKTQGQYILRWDVERAGSGYLSSEGVPDLQIMLNVPSSTPITEEYRSFIPSVTRKNTLVTYSGGAPAP